MAEVAKPRPSNPAWPPARGRVADAPDTANNVPISKVDSFAAVSRGMYQISECTVYRPHSLSVSCDLADAALLHCLQCNDSLAATRLTSILADSIR